MRGLKETTARVYDELIQAVKNELADGRRRKNTGPWRFVYGRAESRRYNPVSNQVSAAQSQGGYADHVLDHPYSDQQVTRREDGSRTWEAATRMGAGLDLGSPHASRGNEERYARILALLSGESSRLDAYAG